MSSPNFSILGCPVWVYVGEDGEQGGIVESASEQGLEVTVVLHCYWLQRTLIYQGLWGTVGFDQSGNIVRTDPLSLPIPPGSGLPAFITGPTPPAYHWERYICTGIGDVRGTKWRTDQDGSITGLAGWGYYEMARITATFGVTSWQPWYAAPGDKAGNGQTDLSGLPYTTTKIRTQGEVICPPHGSYVWTATQVPVDEAHLGLIRAKQEVTITRHRMPTVPTQQVQKVIGRCNGKPIQFGTYLFPAETLLFTGADSEPTSDPGTGLLTQDITYTLIGNGTDNAPPDGNDHTQSFNSILDQTGVYNAISTPAGAGPGAGRKPFTPTNMQAVIWPEYYASGT
jgi:hypothetical protein